MGASKVLGSREIRGMFFHRLEEITRALWLPMVAHDFDSDQASEKYAFLGTSPAMKEWIGMRQKKEPTAYSLTVLNRKFANAVEFDVDDLIRDKTGQIRVRIGDLGARAATLGQSILSTLLTANGTAYDALAFYADRTGVKTGGQIDNDIGAAAVAPTLPTTAEMSTAILAAVTKILESLDDEDEPLSEFATQFAVMVPPNMGAPTAGALKDQFLSGGSSNTIASTPWTITPVVNPRLKAQNTIFHTFRTDADVKPLIWQEEDATTLSAKAEGSDYEHDYDKHEYGAKRKGEGTYGEPGMAIRTTFA